MVVSSSRTFHRAVLLPLETMLLSELDRDCSFTTGSVEQTRQSCVASSPKNGLKAPLKVLLTEVGVFHGLSGRQPLLVVVAQQFV